MTLSIADTIASKKRAMTVPELADLLAVSKVSLYAMVKRGRLPAIKFGSNVRLDPKTTAEWVRERTG